MKKILFVFCLCSVLFSACRFRGREALRLVHWGDLEEIKIINERIAKFKAAHPEIEVTHERVSSGGQAYAEKIFTQFAANQGPDVFLMSSAYAGQFGRSGVLADLGELAGKSSLLEIGHFYPAVVKDFTVNGRLVAIPRDISPVCGLYYNKKAFQEAGLPYPGAKLTWPQPFTGLAQKLTRRDKSGQVTRWGYVDDWAMADVFIYEAGGSYVDNAAKPGRGTLDSPQAIEGIQFRADLINRFKVMPGASSMVNVGGMGGSELFMTGKAAMFYSGIWKIPAFRQIKDFDWDVTLFPAHQKTKKRAWAGGGSGYGFNAQLKGTKRDQAWKLVEFLTSPESQAALAKAGLTQPANQKVANSPAFLDGKVPLGKKVFLEGVNYTYAQPNTSRWDEYLGSGINQALEQVFNGEAGAAQAMKKAVPIANRKIFQRP